MRRRPSCLLAGGFADGGFGSATYTKFIELVSSDLEWSLFGFGRSALSDFFVSTYMPAAASNVQSAGVARTGVPGANAVAPVWRAAQLIRDAYTGAAEGTVALTLLTFWYFAVIRPAAWIGLSFKLN